MLSLSDDFDGLLDEALWQLFSGNIPVSKLTPSPARDTVRLAISAVENKHNNDHAAAVQSIQAKEQMSLPYGAAPELVTTDISKVKALGENISSVLLDDEYKGPHKEAPRILCPDSEIPSFVWDAVVDNCGDLADLPQDVKLTTMVERARAILTVVDKQTMQESPVLEGPKTLLVYDYTLQFETNFK